MLSLPFASDPAELLTGTPSQADAFLMNALWLSVPGGLSVESVIHWKNLLRLRGSEFASHVYACQYWLYDYPVGRLG
jgi:hypothetical protein